MWGVRLGRQQAIQVRDDGHLDQDGDGDKWRGSRQRGHGRGRNVEGEEEGVRVIQHVLYHKAESSLR